MLFDLVALIPFQFLHLRNNRQDLLYVVKLIRLKRGILNLNTKQFLEMYRESQKRQMNKLIEKEPILAEDICHDRTRIGKTMCFSFFLKFLEIIITIVCCSYFFAMSFKFLMEIQNEIKEWDNFAMDSEKQPNHFT